MVETNIAYIKVPFLAPGKAQETKRQLDALLKKGASSVILDLRYTAGGDSKQKALEVANLFVESGTLGVPARAKKQPKELLNADPKQALTKVPVAVARESGQRRGQPSSLQERSKTTSGARLLVSRPLAPAPCRS